MSDFESYFASLEEKITKSSRLQVIKDANDENNRTYKINRALLIWFKAQRLFPYLVSGAIVIVIFVSTWLFMKPNINASTHHHESFVNLEYSYVDLINDDFPWDELGLDSEKEEKIQSLVRHYQVKKFKITEELENYEVANSDYEVEISSLNYELKQLASELSLMIRFLLDEDETHRFFKLCSSLKS